MNLIRPVLVALAAFAAASGPALSQDVNRAVEAVVITPGSSSGLYDVGADVSVTIYTGAAVDFGAVYTVYVNAFAAGTGFSRDGSYAGGSACGGTVPNCAGSCVPTTWDGVQDLGTCRSDGTDCGCHYDKRKSLVSDIVLFPGDLVTVQLVPDAGAAPETILDDDSRSLVFDPAAVHEVNRAIEGIVIAGGSAPGLFDIDADVSVTVYTNEGADHSATYTLFVNGLPQGIGLNRDGSVAPGSLCTGTAPCVGDCEPTTWDGVQYLGTCVDTGTQCVCRYSHRKSLAVDLPLVPGDMLTVSLVALPGAAPETIFDDDSLSEVYDPPPVPLVNRSIDAVLITPGAAGGLYDVGATVSATVTTSAGVDLSAIYQVSVNGFNIVPGMVRSSVAPGGTYTCAGGTPPNGCTGSCQIFHWGGDSVQGTCTALPTYCGCRATRNKPDFATDLVLLPGDVVTVSLVPAPGAEPETVFDDDSLSITFDPATHTAFCRGDGSGGACPCLNQGAPGHGCDVAQGTGGVQLDVLAHETAPLNRATLQGSGFPAAALAAAVVIRGTGQEAGPLAFGDGLRCVAAPLVRLAGTLASGGVSMHTFGHGAAAGSGVFYYQLWFRNLPAMYCTPDAFNLSNGRILTW